MIFDRIIATYRLINKVWISVLVKRRFYIYTAPGFGGLRLVNE